MATILITQCVSTISISTFDGMLSFSNRKKLSQKNCKMCNFYRFLRSEVANVLSNRMSCFFLNFFISCDGPGHSIEEVEKRDGSKGS